MWNLKYDTSELIYEPEQTHRENRLLWFLTGRRRRDGLVAWD